MRTKIIFHKILALVTILVLLLGGIITYKANQNVLTGYYWKNSISNLISINSDVDIALEKTFLQADYDKVMSLMREFKGGLQDFMDGKRVNAFSQAPLDERLLAKLKEAFNAKRELVDKFHSTAMLAALVYDDINFGFLKREQKSELVSQIMSSILLFKYDALNTSLEKPKAMIADKFNQADLSQDDVKFLNLAGKLVGYYEGARQNLIKIQDLNMQGVLDQMMMQNREYTQKATKNLENMTNLFFGLIVFTIGLIYFSYARGKVIVRRLNQFAQVIDNVFSSVIFIDKDRKIKYVNKIFEDTTGYNFSEVKNKTAQMLSLESGSEAQYDEITQAMSENRVWQCEELVSQTKNKELIYEQAMLSPLFDENGDKDGYFLVKFNKTKEILTAQELAKKESELRDRALFDRLTGFGSYFGFTQRLSEQASGTIIYIAINNFMDFRFFYKAKTIDLIIASFAKTLKLCMDTYKMKASAYRMQFDEFCIWYDGEDLRRDIGHIKDYFRANDLFIIVDGKRESIPNIKTTIGVSLMGDTVQTNRLTQAMLAHYEARSKGEAVFYYTENSQIEQQYYRNQIMSRTIEYALYNDTIIVECQGIYDVEQQNKVKYYEILVRLIDENGKIRYPGEFLDIAKKISLYNDITKKVIGHLFRLVEKFPNHAFSINLSNSDIANPQIRDLLEQKLKICSYPNHVYFEILESEGVDDYETVNLFIQKVRDYKCKIAIDDFGSGYSNYYRILELDIDTIKIDGSIIKKLPFDKNARYLLQTIVDFAQRQNYNIVAEFVSSPEILEEVKKFGIKYAQGFLLGKPKMLE